MKRTFAASLLTFSILLTPSVGLAADQAAAEANRYFIPTSKSFWRNALGARRTTPEGFTTDLSDLQLRFAQLAGLKPVAIKKFSILEVEMAEDVMPRATPSAQTGWGVQLIQNNIANSVVGASVSVAILDTGIDTHHPDLSRRISLCQDFTDRFSILVKDSCTDENGHGTHVAGIVAADGGPKGQGSIGLAPTVKIMAMKVCSQSGTCFSDDIAAGMRGAVDAGAQVIVLGFGGEQESSFVTEAITYADEHGALVIAAAGNDGPYDDSLDWPARDARVIAVGAIAGDEKIAEFSSRGLNGSSKPFTREEGDIELAAPGVNIESTFLKNGYAILSGTSMAAPHIAGLAARLWQADAEYPAQATRLLLRELAHDIGIVGDDSESGWGVPRLK
jgi:subtilisin family serine protease